MWPLNYMACETQIHRRMVFTYFWSSYCDNHASMAKRPSSTSPGKFPGQIEVSCHSSKAL